MVLAKFHIQEIKFEMIFVKFLEAAGGEGCSVAYDGVNQVLWVVHNALM